MNKCLKMCIICLCEPFNTFWLIPPQYEIIHDLNGVHVSINISTCFTLVMREHAKFLVSFYGWIRLFLCDIYMNIALEVGRNAFCLLKPLLFRELVYEILLVLFIYYYSNISINLFLCVLVKWFLWYSLTILAIKCNRQP